MAEIFRCFFSIRRKLVPTVGWMQESAIERFYERGSGNQTRFNISNREEDYNTVWTEFDRLFCEGVKYE